MTIFTEKTARPVYDWEVERAAKEQADRVIAAAALLPGDDVRHYPGGTSYNSSAAARVEAAWVDLVALVGRWGATGMVLHVEGGGEVLAKYSPQPYPVTFGESLHADDEQARAMVRHVQYDHGWESDEGLFTRALLVKAHAEVHRSTQMNGQAILHKVDDWRSAPSPREGVKLLLNTVDGARLLDDGLAVRLPLPGDRSLTVRYGSAPMDGLPYRHAWTWTAMQGTAVTVGAGELPDPADDDALIRSVRKVAALLVPPVKAWWEA